MDALGRTTANDLDSSSGDAHGRWRRAVGDTSSNVIVLPGASSAEGIAKGRGSTFYAGELFTGDIFRGNVRSGTAKKFIDAPDGRNALGMIFDHRHNLLFVAGGPTGQAYVYNTRT